jgi:hypothetical protein
LAILLGLAKVDLIVTKTCVGITVAFTDVMGLARSCGQVTSGFDDWGRENLVLEVDRGSVSVELEGRKQRSENNDEGRNAHFEVLCWNESVFFSRGRYE